MSELEALFNECQKVKEEADCLFDKQTVHNAVVKLSEAISEKLSTMEPVVVGVMNGGLIPMGLLLPELDFPLQVDYLHATRYRDKTRGGQLQWLVSPNISLLDRTVLLVDDIHDEGVTLDEIKKFCFKEGAKNVFTAVLVNKIHDRKNNTSVDFVGLEIPDRYVFGFGMDYKGMLRNAPGIFAVKGL
jgi:hypoxanthine phosphoribosyltransferase